MNKLWGVVVLGAALGLSACGGDSDSSGDSRFESEVILTPAVKSVQLNLGDFNYAA